MPESMMWMVSPGLLSAVDDRALTKAANSKLAAQHAQLLGGKSGEASYGGQIEPQFPGGARVAMLARIRR